MLSPEEVAVVLDSIADGVFTVDRDFTITSFNRAAERITGFAADEAIGQRCYNIFRTSVCQGGCLLDESIHTDRVISGAKMTILNRHNNEVPISVSTSVLRDTDGQVIGGVETFRDLTAVEELRREIERRYSLYNMRSKNHRMQEIFALVPDVAASTASVLIEGETGTGKELLAQAIHHESPRANGPFVKVNCGALPDQLLESELFGHVAGAFTDARADRIGRFELANGGTLFLDEIGDTSPAMQVKLLRVLQEGHFEPVGSSETRSTDVRIISATHRDLKERVVQGKFREDLFYRVQTIQLTLPPLRDRKEDIPLLIEHFIERFNGLTGKEVRNVSGDCLHALMRYDWRGNIRQLEHAIEHAYVLVKDATIALAHLPKEIQQVGTFPPIQSADDVETVQSSPLADSERQVIHAVLQRHHWNRDAVCRELGLSRTTLWRKMRKLGIQEK